MSQINKKHLDFLEECREAFDSEILRETHFEKGGDLIGLRYGVDRDCIRMFELGEEIALFTKMVKPTDADEYIVSIGEKFDKGINKVGTEVGEFSAEMEKQLQANEHKGGWQDCTNEYLAGKLKKNLSKMEGCISHSEFRRRCANIANFAMMLADNDRREELKRS